MASKAEIASIMLEAAELLKEDNVTNSKILTEAVDKSVRKNFKTTAKGAKAFLKKYKKDGDKNALNQYTSIMRKLIAQYKDDAEALKFIGCDMEVAANIEKDATLKAELTKMVNLIKKKTGVSGTLADYYAGNPKKQALQEAVNLLYEKATLTENAEEAAMYVEKAEEIQKEIDEIPEEKPVEMDEYPADDVTGGAGAGDEDKQEAIKDLVNNDATAEKLLTDDENKSVTVDESAIDILFEAAANSDDPELATKLMDIASNLM